MRGDVGRVPVRHRRRLERAAGLVEAAPQRSHRGRPARGRPDLPARRRERVPALAGELDRVAVAGIDDRAEQRPARGGVDRDEGGHADRLGQHHRIVGRFLELEQQDGDPAVDPERLQTAAQILVAEPAAERLGEDVAGESSLRLPDRPLPHQLERDHHRRLAGEETFEIADVAGPPRQDQPMAAAAAPTERDRHDDRPARERAPLGDEHRLPAGLGPLVDLDPDVGGRLLGEAALLGMARQLQAALVEQHRRP